MNFEKEIRKLARSSFYQNLYSISKESSSIHLFDNNNNFSGIQVLFLFWLQTYHLLYDELIQKKWRFLDEEIIKDDERCDAFLYWRKKQQEKELENYKKDQRISNLKLKNKENVTAYNVNFS